jgi:hypothetical protein
MTMRHTLYILALLLLPACKSPDALLHDLLTRYPELVRTDTTETAVAIPVPPDTIREQVLLRDTVTIESTRQVVRIVRVPTGSPCDDVPVMANVLAYTPQDTVYKYVRIPCDTVQPTRVVYAAPWWVYPLVGVLLLSLVLALWRK